MIEAILYALARDAVRLITAGALIGLVVGGFVVWFIVR